MIADGYHRICAVYEFDEDKAIECKIIDLEESPKVFGNLGSGSFAYRAKGMMRGILVPSQDGLPINSTVPSSHRHGVGRVICM